MLTLAKFKHSVRNEAFINTPKFASSELGLSNIALGAVDAL
jgi:hypothetical protein